MQLIWDFLASTFIAAMAGLGIGGGGLLIIYLTLVKQMPQLPAQGINLLFFLFASASSLIIHIKEKRISWKLLLILAPLGIVGAVAGSYVAKAISPLLIRRIFAVLLILSGLMELIKKEKKNSPSIPSHS